VGSIFLVIACIALVVWMATVNIRLHNLENTKRKEDQ